MRIFLFFILSFFAVNAFAQDYYLTMNKNKTPLKVKSAAAISELLKKQGKDSKYQVVILNQNPKGAVYTLVPASLSVETEDNVTNITSLKEGNVAFGLTVEFPDKLEDVQAGIEEMKTEFPDLKLTQSNKLYSRIKYKRYDVSSSEFKQIILQAPYAGKYVQMSYTTEAIEAKDKDGKPMADKNEAVLGIAASSLNRAVFTAETPKEAQKTFAKTSVKVSAKPAEEAFANAGANSAASEVLPPVISELSIRKLAPRASEISFILTDGENVYLSKITTVQEYPSAKAEGGRLILKAEKDAFMWLEPVFKDSKAYNASILQKYAPGKKFNTPRKNKVKVGTKEVNMVKYSALNESTISYFFKDGGRRFVLSFIAPSSKLPAYEKSSAEILRGFSIEQAASQEEELF